MVARRDAVRPNQPPDGAAKSRAGILVISERLRRVAVGEGDLSYPVQGVNRAVSWAVVDNQVAIVGLRRQVAVVVVSIADRSRLGVGGREQARERVIAEGPRTPSGR